MAAPPTPPTKTLSATGPVIIVILIIAAAILGYYQIVVYPSVAPTSTSTSAGEIPTSKLTVNVTIPPGSGSNPSKGTSFYYQPDSITVYIGYNSTVRWINNDSAVHTVTATPNSPDPRFNAFGPTNQPWNNIQPDASVNFTFTTPGTYNYSCSYHNWMKGEVIVKTPPPGLVVSNSSAAASTTSVSGGSQASTSNISQSGAVSGSSSTSSAVNATSVQSTAVTEIKSAFQLGSAWEIDFAKSLATRIGSGIAP